MYKTINFPQKMLKKQLTNLIESDNIYKLSAEMRKGVEKSIKKSFEKLSKKSWQTRECVIYSSSCLRERNSESEKSQEKAKSERFEKNLKKLSKKYWQREKSMIYSLSCLRERVAIGPWKLNNEIRKGTRDSMVNNHQEEFLKVLFKQ